MRLALLLTIFIAGEGLQGQSLPKDLYGYEVLGPFGLSYRNIDDPHIYEQVREFLWRHWKQKTKATVRLRQQWVEGIYEVAYFVEPSKSGNWSIVESRGGTERSCDHIERVEPNRLRVPVIPIPDAELRSPDRYLLHPKCWADRPVATLW